MESCITEVECEVSCLVVSGYIHVECKNQRLWGRKSVYFK